MAKPDTKSPAFRAAWRKGYSAGMRGLEWERSPYLPKPHEEQVLAGWSLQYHRMFVQGWADGCEVRTGVLPEVTDQMLNPHAATDGTGHG